MTQLKLVLRSIKHYFSANVWLALGVALTTAVITGGLIVGDSVKYSLEQAAELRLGEITHALSSGDRYFTTALAERITDEDILCTAALKQEAVVSSGGGVLTLNKVAVWGIDDSFWTVAGVASPISDNTAGQCLISENTAIRLNLNEGDDILLKIEKASLIPANAPFVSDEEQTIAYRTTVGKIIGEKEMGRLNLQTSQTAPFNVFLPIQMLNELMTFSNTANVLLLSSDLSSDQIKNRIQEQFTLEDAGLSVISIETTDQWELRSSRVFIDTPMQKFVANTGLEYTEVLTYFSNYFKKGDQTTPYSFISSLADDQLSDHDIIINSWLADDLKAKVGDSIALGYYEIGALRQLNEKSRTFKVKEVVPIQGYYADRNLMPQIPGLSDSENCRDWQTGVPVDLKTIRDKDEEYWYNYRGLPKAFVSLAAAREMWSNRFGSATAFRFNREQITREELEQTIKEQLMPFELDFQLSAVKEQGSYAAKNGTDFSQLFIGLSFFILVSGLMLTALLFRFNLEKRTSEIGTLSSLGYSNRKIQNIFLHEGIIVARTGAAIGLVLALAYNKLVFWGLNQVWYDIVRTDVLVPKIKITTLLIGFLVSIVVAMVTIWLTLKRKLKANTASLQKKASTSISKPLRISLLILSILSLAYALFSVTTEFTKNELNSGAFFMAGGLLLLSAVLFFYLFLSKATKKSTHISSWSLIANSIRNNRTRSLTVVLLLAIGTYLVVSTGMNRKDLFANAGDPKGGTGGYLFWAESTVPILHNLNDAGYRKNEGLTTDFSIVQMRVAEGDDASCLNLNRITNPRILGLETEQLQGRFSVQTHLDGIDVNNFWNELKQDYGECIPAIADQTVLQWSLGIKVGDTLTYKNGVGEEVKLIMIAGLNASVFQGNVVIDNANFLKHFPTSSGSNVFLIDGSADQQQAIQDDLIMIYRDFGLDITSAPARLAEFMSVNNTYLSIFLVLGALGLLIGTIGLGVVLQRSLLDRKSEFALMNSLGFSNRNIYHIVTTEYIILLLAGMFIGFVSAIVSVYPAIKGTIDNVSPGFVASLMLIITINGVFWILVLAAFQLRKINVIDALRND